MQVQESGEGESEMVVEFVNAEDGAVTDSISLHNSLRRDRHCSYCYSRSNGVVLQPPLARTAVAGQDVRAECGEGHGTGDLEALARERLAAEHPKWAALLDDEISVEQMLSAPEESENPMMATLQGILGHFGLAWDGEQGSVRAIILAEDPDAV